MTGETPLGAAPQSTHPPLPTPRSIRLVAFLPASHDTQTSTEDIWQGLANFEHDELLQPDVPNATEKPTSLRPVVKTFDLDQCPPFFALSYTWDNPLDKYTFGSILEGPWRRKEESKTKESQRVEFDLGMGPFNIPKNLQTAIGVLCNGRVGTAPLWIDAICIDQANSKEKGTQVALMGEIYSKAAAVIVWLGPDSWWMKTCDWIYGVFCDALEAYIEKRGIERLRNMHPYDGRFQIEIGARPEDGNWKACWHAYIEFCWERRWFTRAWVVQEISLNRNVYVWCQGKYLKWSRIEWFSSLLRELGWEFEAKPWAHWSFGVLDEPVDKQIFRMCDIKAVYKDIVQQAEDSDSGGPRDVDRVQRGPVGTSQGHSTIPGGHDMATRKTPISPSLHSSDCSDPRDKIYAYLGMMQKVLQGKQMPIVPDYSDSYTVRTLYKTVGVMLLGKIPRLATLSYAEYGTIGNQTSRCPSWTPDYRIPKGQPFISIRMAGYSFDCWPEEFGGSVFKICGEILETRGVMVDKIEEISLSPEEAVRKHHAIPLIRLAAKMEIPYWPTRQDPSEVFWRTLIADTYQCKPAANSLAGDFKHWITTLFAARANKLLSVWPVSAVDVGPRIQQTWDDMIRPFVNRMAVPRSFAFPSYSDIIEYTQKYPITIGGDTSENRNSSIITFDRQTDKFEEIKESLQLSSIKVGNSEIAISQRSAASETFVTSLLERVRRRRLFRTKRGLLGLGPESMQAGDQVWMVQGAMVPFVLRRKGAEFHRVVGESYLHGFMDGKMASKMKDKVETVRLK
ncbi:Heterokaryon incompatibility protein (HET) domain containing protein [Hyaloscypha variabilis]